MIPESELLGGDMVQSELMPEAGVCLNGSDGYLRPLGLLQLSE